MDTNRLKRFATEARNILMQGVKNRLQAIGFDLKTGTPSEMPRKMEGGAVFMGDTVTTDFYSRWMSLYMLAASSRWLKRLPTHGSTASWLSASCRSRASFRLSWLMKAKRCVCQSL